MTSTGDPDLEGLRALVLTAELGSMSRAGAALSVSQQAVSQRIRAVEADLGVRLLVRTPRGSRLTSGGELVVGWATTLLGAADTFTAATRALRDSGGPLLRLAASLTVAEHVLPGWIARWRAEQGEDGPLIQVAAANSAAVVESVREGRVDLGLVETPTVAPDLSSLTIGTDHIDVVVAPTHRWARMGVITPADLARTPLVLREEGSGTRETLETALSAAGHPRLAAPAVIASTTLSVRSAIMAGTAPGALSSRAVDEDVRAHRLVRVRVRSMEIRRPLTAVWLSSEPSSAARGFLDLNPSAAQAPTPA